MMIALPLGTRTGSYRYRFVAWQDDDRSQKPRSTRTEVVRDLRTTTSLTVLKATCLHKPP
eukprot:scaffold468955_cov20-Prasinocladus_malaysianus.AAC.1